MSSWYNCAAEIPQDASRLTQGAKQRERTTGKHTCKCGKRHNFGYTVYAQIRAVTSKIKLIPSDARNDDVALEIMQAVQAFMRMLAAELPGTI